jgi:hypothetical protein
MKHFVLSCLACIWCLFASTAPAWSQQPTADAVAGAVASVLPPGYEGPPAPVPPEVITRDGARVTVRAVEVTTPFRVDGKLDEAAYATVKSMSDFIQNDPRPGQPGTEKTEVWIFYDKQNVYVMARLWESEPETIMATEMRRDASVFNDDNFAWSFDTFYDRRNGFVFEVSASGGWLDGQVANERSLNRDFNPVWGVKVGRFEGGWTMESAIPFKSLRYKTGQTQIWGFQARRFNRKKNEVSFLTPLSAAHGRAGHFRSSLSATVVGLRSPSGSRTLEVKPYATSSVTTDVNARPSPLSNDPAWNGGLDVKYSITQNLTSDFTYRTDFAQVEADEQQVNLTRFNLAFPEKRDFFLENSGTFTFGGATQVGTGNNATQSDTPQMFYSRRIGLNGGRVIPMVAGGRTTGRVGAYSLGGIYVRTDEEEVSASPANNFAILRLRRDLARRSSVGALFTNRSAGVGRNGSNQAYGLDTIVAFSDVFAVNAYWARTDTPGRSNASQSYRAQLDYNADRYGLQLERLSIDPDFNPEIGFVRRADMRKNFGEFRFSPRFRTSKRIRRIFFTNGFTQVQNSTGRTESRLWEGEFAIDFMNSDRFAFQRSAQYEYLPTDFAISPAAGITLQKGNSYDFGEWSLTYNFGRQRPLSGNVTATRGSFYSGDRTSLTLAQGRVNVTSKFSFEPTYTLNNVELEEGAFTSHLLGSRINYTTSPMMFTSALVQFNSDTKTISANVRLRWQYEPGSEFFIVYNEQRDTQFTGFPEMQNRALIFKINKFFRP